MAKKELLDPTVEFCKAIRRDTRKRGAEIANKHFEGDMAVVMGEVLGDILANGVLNNIGDSLYDVPMR